MQARDISRWFGVLERQSQSYISYRLKEMQLTFSEYVLLLHLYENEGVSQEEMAALLMVDKAAVARTSRCLQERGLLRKRQCNLDKRKKHLYCTAEGKAAQPFFLKILKEWIDFLCAGMDEAAIKLLLQSFKTLAQRAKEADFSRVAARGGELR